jgi:hypothetical protein
MKLEKVFLIIFILVIGTYISVKPGSSQISRDEIVSFPGAIESVGKDFKFIVVNETRIYISSNTNIGDEKGSVLSVEDLKPRLSVTIEAVRNPEGFFARKIVIRTLRMKP